jgi:hypothetical protein
VPFPFIVSLTRPNSHPEHVHRPAPRR